MNTLVIILLVIGFGLFLFNVVNAFIGYGDMRAIEARHEASMEAYQSISAIINAAQHCVHPQADACPCKRRNMLECCGRKFSVHKMEPAKVDPSTFVLSSNISWAVRFCPFCGRNLIPLAVDVAKPGEDKTFKSYWKDGKLVRVREIPPRR